MYHLSDFSHSIGEQWTCSSLQTAQVVLDGAPEAGKALAEAVGRFRFRHPIVRAAVYQSAGSGWRLDAHARVAEALARSGATPSARAHHVERSARPGDVEVQAGDFHAADAVAREGHELGATLETSMFTYKINAYYGYTRLELGEPARCADLVRDTAAAAVDPEKVTSRPPLWEALVRARCSRWTSPPRLRV